jgi:adenylate cyclase
MIGAIETLNAELGRQAANEGWQLPKIGIGIGINTGDAVVGNMGSERRFDYSALGDTVNLASRLESLSKTYGEIIIISEATRRRIGNDFATRQLDRVQVKGRNEPVTIFTIAIDSPPV